MCRVMPRLDRLQEDSVVSFWETTAADGKKHKTKSDKPDAVISPC
jgi:hypothetical protein